jgi:arylsulfatase A-like enzyme
VEGNIQNHEALHRHCLPPSIPTIAELLEPAGYHTGFIGKWHCGWHEDHAPDRRGFSVAKGYRTIPTATRGHFGRDFIEFRCKDLDDLQEDDYMSDVLTDHAIEFITNSAKKDKPFFLALNHYLVHTPLSAPEELVEKYRQLPTTDQENPVYAAMLEKLDQSVGRVTQVLKDLGIADNTMIVFTSDNGGLSPDSTSNYPLMGGKSFCYEAAMRVPLVVRWPNGIPPEKTGRRESTRTNAIDLVPTWLEMAGVTRSEDLLLDGVSLLDLISKDQRPERRPIFFHHPHYTHAAGPFSSVIQDDWKLIRFYNDTSGAYQLFDLASDPYEQDDLANARPKKAAVLRGLLEAWLVDIDAEAPILNEAFDADRDPVKDKAFTWHLALRERREHERKLRISKAGKQQ